jgi:transposase
MDHIGIDLHKKESQICILSEDGERLESRVRTTPARFADVLGDRPRARIRVPAVWCGDGHGRPRPAHCPS